MLAELCALIANVNNDGEDPPSHAVYRRADGSFMRAEDFLPTLPITVAQLTPGMGMADDDANAFMVALLTGE